MKKLVVYLAVLAAALSCGAQEPAKTGYGSGAPSAVFVPGPVGSIYVDQSTSLVYFCTAITIVNRIPNCTWTQEGGSGGLSGMTAGQVPKAATSSTVTSSIPIQGTDTSLLSSGTVSGTASPLCTDASGGATTSGCPSATISNQVLNQLALGGASASAVSGTVANGLTGQVLQSTNGAVPSFSSPGLPWGNGSAAVTATPYAVACDSGTAVADRGTTILFQSGASVINLPDPTAAGCTGNFAVSLYDDGAGTLTVNRGGTSTINVMDGTTNTDGATSFTLATGQTALCNANAAGTIWACRKLTGGGNATQSAQVSAVTNYGVALGAQTIVASVPVTGMVTVFMNSTQSLAGVGCSSATNSVTPTISFTAPGGTVKTIAFSGANMTQNGAVDTISAAALNGAANESASFPAKSGTAITYTTASTLASTGCTTTPQYTVYAKAIY